MLIILRHSNIHLDKMEKRTIERILVIAFLTNFCFVCQGCTYQSWYEGLREGQLQECQKHINPDEIQRCLDSIGNMTYEQYLKSRQKSDE